jgi:LacI family transcriptional regulator
LRGFSAGLAEFGLKLDPGMVLEGSYTYESGVECATRLFARADRPTAIFVGNDEMAVGVYQAADSAGLKIPSDLSVVGFDDAPMASRIRPPLTTVLLPIRDMGRMAAEMLIANRRGTDSREVKTASFVPVLVVRASTARPPGSG